jgi:hypothetical protein
MVVPDLHRFFRPLAFSADNDGVITEVQGPFAASADSPAFATGLRPGDRLDLTRMRCVPFDTLTCTSTMAALGGFRLVINQDRIRLALAGTAEQPARTVDIVAKPRVPDHWVRMVLLLDQDNRLQTAAPYTASKGAVGHRRWSGSASRSAPVTPNRKAAAARKLSELTTADESCQICKTVAAHC